MPKRNIHILFLLSCAIAVIFSCREDAEKQDELSGKELSEIYCTSCHMYPSPELLDYKTWHDHVLVRMSAYMGVYYDNVKYYDQMPAQWLEPGLGGQKVMEAGIYPSKAIITREEWKKIRAYYLDNAPKKIEAANTPELNVGLPGFKKNVWLENGDVFPHITALSISGQHIYAAVYQSEVIRLNKNGAITSRKNFGTMPVQIGMIDGKFVATDIGSRHGRDLPSGSVSIYNDWNAFVRDEVEYNLKSLMRPLQSRNVDIDKDGEADLIICEYGNLLGRCSIKFGGGDDELVLFGDDGSITCDIIDMNNDGLEDIVLLHANSDEGIELYVNKGQREFEKKSLLRFLPTNGSTSMQLIDWEDDGDLDILYTQGDNGDYYPLLKPHHGIRLFVNDGSNNFEEAFYLPMNGAYQCEAFDFDEDGDKDIAAISFHPDFNNGAKEGFVYFLNEGADSFKAFTIEEVDMGRWMCLESGDVDGDGDHDILIGAFDIKTPEVPQTYADEWENNSIPFIYFENTLR